MPQTLNDTVLELVRQLLKQNEQITVETRAPWEATLTPRPDWVEALNVNWKSESIDKIAQALSQAQGEIENASKDSENPHFRNRYADLASVWDVCRKPLAKYELSVVQRVLSCAATNLVWVHTVMMHSSGQWISGLAESETKDKNPQTAGSAVTYLRRYSLSSITGVAPDDDDAETAAGRTKPAQPQAQQQQRAPQQQQRPQQTKPTAPAAEEAAAPAPAQVEVPKVSRKTELLHEIRDVAKRLSAVIDSTGVEDKQASRKAVGEEGVRLAGIHPKLFGKLLNNGGIDWDGRNLVELEAILKLYRDLDTERGFKSDAFGGAK